MTSIEPGLIDANVFVYAFDTEAPQHIASRNLLEAGRAGQATLYVTSHLVSPSLPPAVFPASIRRRQGGKDYLRFAVEAGCFLFPTAHDFPNTRICLNPTPRSHQYSSSPPLLVSTHAGTPRFSFFKAVSQTLIGFASSSETEFRSTAACESCL
jgi:hypothetical protein